VEVGEVAPAAAGDEDFFAGTLCALEEADGAATLAGGDGAHEACGACAEDEDVVYGSERGGHGGRLSADYTDSRRFFFREDLGVSNGEGKLLGGGVKPFRKLGETRTPDGAVFSLHEHDGEFFLKLNGRQLMSTTATTSELMLAQLPCDGLRGRADTRVLIGGLGLGFSLQRTLELVGRHARVEVAELLPEVVGWNRELLRGVNGRLLEDRRVEVITGDVYDVLRKAGAEAYDAIMLDVDNGPTSMVQAGNARIYRRRGLGVIAQALKKGGKVAFWSAVAEPEFLHDLARAGLRGEGYPAKSHDRAKREAHVIYLAERGG